MNNFRNYLLSCEKETIETIYRCFGYEIEDTKQNKKSLISKLTNLVSSEPETWLQRLPYVEMSIITHLVELGPNKDYPISGLPYTPIIEKLHIVSISHGLIDGEKFYTISNSVYKAIKHHVHRAFLNYMENGYKELEECLIGVLTIHGVIEIGKLKEILSKVDKYNYKSFILNSLLVRLHMRKKMGRIYVYHPAIKNLAKVFSFKNYLSRHIKARKYSIKEYRELSESSPLISYGIHRRIIEIMKEHILLLDFNESSFNIIYQDIFLAVNEGNFNNLASIILAITSYNKDNEEQSVHCDKFLTYITSIPMWVLDGYSIDELESNKWFTSNIESFIKLFWEIDQISTELDFNGSMNDLYLANAKDNGTFS